MGVFRSLAYKMIIDTADLISAVFVTGFYSFLLFLVPIFAFHLPLVFVFSSFSAYLLHFFFYLFLVVALELAIYITSNPLFK
jgi:hypothetical protein